MTASSTPPDREVDGVVDALDLAIGSLQFDAAVLLLNKIVQSFEDGHVDLHDFLLALSHVIHDRHGNEAVEIIPHMELAASAAGRMIPPLRGQLLPLRVNTHSSNCRDDTR